MSHSSPVIAKLGKVAQAWETKACKGATSGERKSRRKIIRLAARDGKQCHWCHGPVYFSWEPSMHVNHSQCASFDHKKLKCNGGSDKVWNGLLACRQCNSTRANTEYEEFKALVAEKGIEFLVAEKNQGKKGKKTTMSRKAQKALDDEKRIERKRAKNRAQNRRRSKRRYAAFKRNAYKYRWLNWMLTELSEWGQIFNRVGVAF